MTKNTGFSEDERAAMKARAEELKAEKKGGNKLAREYEACLDAIAEMPDEDRLVAERIHAIVADVAPQLNAKTWYGMPAYTHDGKVVCFFKGTHKFGGRFQILGFEDEAQLDDGDMWPTVFAITKMTPAVEKRIADLVRTAAG